MIFPTSRLLFWVAVIVLPFATLAGMYQPAALICSALIGLFLVVVLIDAILSFSALDSIGLKASPVVRASKDRPSKLELFITRSKAGSKRLRIGLPFGTANEPAAPLVSDHDILDLVVPETEFSKVDWPFLGRRRGNFPLNRAYLESPSPLGFWAFRRQIALQCEIRVYPNLLTERKNLAALFLNRGSFGLHAQRQVGKGRDFEKLREYTPGDSYDEIHWKATAKRGHPVTKVFQIERTQEIYVLIDASRLSARRVHSLETPAGVPVLERYITAALVLGLAAERQGDLFGLLTFSDKVESFV